MSSLTPLSTPRGLVVPIGLLSAIFVTLTLMARPLGVIHWAGLLAGGLTMVAAVRAWRTGDGRFGSGALLGLFLQVALFLAGPAGTAPIDRFRIVQIAGIVACVGLVAAVLFLRWNPSMPARAVLIGSVIALVTLGLDRLLGVGTPEDVVPARESWTDSSDAHTRLGRVPRPNSAFKVFYEDDRDGYLREEDMRARTTELSVQPGSDAELLLPPEKPQLFRVAIRKAHPDTTWHIQLSQARFPLERQIPYFVTFRARADRRRTIAVAVTQNHAPWAPMGLYLELELTPQWKGFREVFTARRSDTNSMIVFHLAGHDAPVEVDSLELHGPPSGRRIVPIVKGLRPYVSYQRNGMGCRNREQPSPPAGRGVRLLALGDAFTEGVGVHENDTFARLLERDLNRSSGGSSQGGGLEVINCGVAGYGTREQLLFYELFAGRTNPDLVLITMGWDDDRFHWEERQKALLAASPGRLERLSAIARRVGASARQSRIHDYGPSIEDILALDKVVRARGARLIVAVSRHGPPGLGDSLLATARRGLAGRDIPLYDLGMLGAVDSIPDDADGLPGHRGHHAVALDLAGWLRKEVLDRRVVTDGPAKGQ